jgi:hypothetical protein
MDKKIWKQKWNEAWKRLLCEHRLEILLSAAEEEVISFFTELEILTIAYDKVSQRHKMDMRFRKKTYTAFIANGVWYYTDTPDRDSKLRGNQILTTGTFDFIKHLEEEDFFEKAYNDRKKDNF